MKAIAHRLLAVLASSVLLSGCTLSFMDERMPSSAWQLEPGNPPSASRRIPGSVSIGFFDVSSPFGTGDFRYRLSESDWETDPYNRFVSSPQEMITTIVRSWVRDSGQFQSVALPNTGTIGGYHLEGDVTDLYVDFRNPDRPEAIIKMEIEVFSGSGQARKKLLTRTFVNRAPVRERSPEAFVDAWNAALRANLLGLSAALSSARLPTD